MGVVDQLGRNLEAALSRLLDAASDPAKGLDQTLADLREQLQAGRRELVRAIAGERRLRDAVTTALATVDKWQARAELAIRHGDDELAKRALQQKHRLTQEHAAIQRSHQEHAATAAAIRTTLTQMERRYRDFDSRQGTLRAKLAQNEPSAPGFGRANAALREFDEIGSQVDQVEDVFTATREVDEMLSANAGSEPDLELRFAALEQQSGGGGEKFAAASELDEELDALKHRLRVRV